MKQVIVRYKVKRDRAAENEELVRAVYAELHDSRPAGLHYATFKLEDGALFGVVTAASALQRGRTTAPRRAELDSLTLTERRVAAMAEGLSNREVAESPLVTLCTVEKRLGASFASSI